MRNQFSDQFNGSPLTHSFDTTLKKPSSQSEPVSLRQSPSSANSSSSFNTNEGDPKKGHKKKNGMKGGSLTYRITEHAKLVKEKLSLGTKVIKEEGRGNTFKQIFGENEGEELLKAYQCSLPTTEGPIAGLLYISTQKIAFCSEKPIRFPSATTTEKFIRELYRVVIPIKKIKRANQSENVNNPEQKYIEIVTEDDFEFWFMQFLTYEKAYKTLEKALSMANQM